MNDENKIVKTLNNPSRFLFWDLGECMIFVLSFLVGGALESLIVVLVGIVVWYFFRKLNGLAKKKGVIPFHFIYWNIPTKTLRRSGKFLSVPCSHKRDIIL